MVETNSHVSFCFIGHHLLTHFMSPWCFVFRSIVAVAVVVVVVVVIVVVAAAAVVVVATVRVAAAVVLEALVLVS